MKWRRVAWIVGSASALVGVALFASAVRTPQTGRPLRNGAERATARLESAVRAHPHVAEARVALIRHLVSGGRLNEALDAAREAAGVLPGNPSVTKALATALTATAREPEAARLLRTMPAEDTESRVELARALLAIGDREGAAGELRKLPPLPHALADRAARLALEALDPRTALRTLGATASPRPAVVQGLLGRALVWIGDYAAAILYLEEALRQSPGDVDAALHLAAAVRLQGNAAGIARSRALLEELAQRTAGDPAILYELARSAIASDDPAPAVRALEAAASTAPDWSEIWEDLATLRARRGDRVRRVMASARVLQLTGEAPTAVTLLAREATREPRNVELGLAVAAAYSHAGDQQSLRATLRELRKRHPQNREVLDALSQVETDLQNHTRALEALDVLFQISPSAGLARRRARLLQLLQRRPEAGTLLRRLRDESPGDARGHFELGAFAAAAGSGDLELAEAETSLREAVRLNPDFADAHRELGSVLQRTGRSAAAIPHLRRALDLAPRDAEACRLLGLAYAASGDLERSREVFELFRRLRMESELRQRLLASLARFNRQGESDENGYRQLLRLGEWEAALRELERNARAGGLDRARRADMAALYGRALRFQRQAEQVRLLRAGGGRR